MSRGRKYVTDRDQMRDADSQNYVARRVRDLDYDRYFSTLFCPAGRRDALLALYAFNLEIATIRETVSEPLIGQIRLQWWRDALGSIYEGRPPGHPVAAALAGVIERHLLAREDFERMLDGRETDLEEQPDGDLASLERYAEATSSSLVALAFGILAARDTATDEIARHAGIAWCLSGLLRAAPYVGVARPELIVAREPPATARDMRDRIDTHRVREIAVAARRHLDEARRLQDALPRRALAAILPLAHVAPFLDRLARAGHQPIDPRLDLSRARRQWLSTKAALRGGI